MVFQSGAAGTDQLPTQGQPRDIVDAIKRYRDLGVSHFVFDFVPEARDVALDTMNRFAQEVRPQLT